MDRMGIYMEASAHLLHQGPYGEKPSSTQEDAMDIDAYPPGIHVQLPKIRIAQQPEYGFGIGPPSVQNPIVQQKHSEPSRSQQQQFASKAISPLSISPMTTDTPISNASSKLSSAATNTQLQKAHFTVMERNRKRSHSDSETLPQRLPKVICYSRNETSNKGKH